MEKYSPQMKRNVRAQLRQASPEFLAVLVPGFLKRQGPGLVLLRKEHRRRGFPFPPACPACGQQRNRCICLPWLQSQFPTTRPACAAAGISSSLKNQSDGPRTN